MLRDASRLLTGLRPLKRDDESLLRPFYRSLHRPLADLNSMMMIAWREALDLSIVIEAGILYVVARWEERPALWGPPLGADLSIHHIECAFDLLSETGAGDAPEIFYLWPEYPLWSEIQAAPHFLIQPQAFEYIYDVTDLASLRGSHRKTKRKERRRIDQNPSVQWERYTSRKADESLALLDRWVAQKHRCIESEDIAKFEMETRVCRGALLDRLDLDGVVLIVDGQLRGFSIGAPHANGTFNCMFEKSDLEIPGAATALFSHLADSCAGTYDEINAGEDWSVGYLRRSKQAWKPKRLQASYRIARRLRTT